jgi:hypothetical protein
MLRKPLISLASLVLLAGAPAIAGNPAPAMATDHDHAAAAPTSAAFERIKGLAGEWIAAEDGPMTKKGDLVARYTLTAGGSAVVETLLPGTPHEMVTVYTAEGQDVVLSHFCLNANAPRMRAKAPAGARYEFAYDGGTNIAPAVDKHMHSAWIEFVGKDELKSQWTELDHGQQGMVVNMHTVRKAS